MKRFLTIVFSFIVLLTGCTNKKLDKVPLIYGTLEKDTFYGLVYSELENKIIEEANFIILVSPLDESCICWNDFRFVIDQYIKENHVLVYKIKYNELKDKEVKFDLSVNDLYASINIIENGKVKYKEQYNPKVDKSLFNDFDLLSKYFSDRIILPKYLYISLEQLDAKLLEVNGNPFVLYLGREKCPFCKYIDWRFLKDFQLKNEVKTMYVINLQQYHPSSNENSPESNESWQLLKNRLGMSNVINTELGWGVGYTPTIQYIEPTGNLNSNEYVKDNLQYFSETLTKQEDGNYKVTSTYYTSERLSVLSYLNGVSNNVLLDLIVDSSEVSSSGSWSQEKSEVYHRPIAEAFFNKYLKVN